MLSVNFNRREEVAEFRVALAFLAKQQLKTNEGISFWLHSLSGNASNYS